MSAQSSPAVIRGGVARDPGVVERPLGGDDMLVVLHSEVRCICEEAPEQCEPPRVAALLLERQRRAAELLRLRRWWPSGRRRDAQEEAIARASIAPEPSLAASARSATASAASAAARRPTSRHPGGFQLECEVEPDAGAEARPRGEERKRGPVVEAVARAPAGGGEPLRSAFRKIRVGLSELGLRSGPPARGGSRRSRRARRAPAVLVEPVGEAGVQVGADRLRKGVVGGVADQQVAEAVAVLAGELGAVGTDQLAAHECGESGRDLRLLGSECLHGAAVEDLAFDRAALQHPPLGLVELVEPSRQ